MFSMFFSWATSVAFAIIAIAVVLAYRSVAAESLPNRIGQFGLAFTLLWRKSTPLAIVLWILVPLALLVCSQFPAAILTLAFYIIALAFGKSLLDKLGGDDPEPPAGGGIYNGDGGGKNPAYQTQIK